MSVEIGSMPGGSQYRGPEQALERYRAMVESSATDADVKGAKNPYTSRNGHMFSFLTAEGTIALRLSRELAAEFGSQYEIEPVIQYGKVMRDYVEIPDDLAGDAAGARFWFERSFEWIGTLEPK